MTGPVIITADIETAPLEAWTWGTFKQNVGLNQIKADWSILSASWKYLGKRGSEYIDTSNQRNVLDDRKLLKPLWHMLNEADIIIGQNVKKFDIRKINARLIEAGFKPYRPVKVVDTMLEARAIGAFTSNKLEYLSDKLTKSAKDKHNEFPGFELWKACLARDPKAWAVMKKYNGQDIRSTEELYLVLRPWIIGHPNVAAFYDDDLLRCPKCGSTHIHSEGTTVTQVSEYNLYLCDNCGGWSRDRYTINSKAKRRSLLSN